MQVRSFARLLSVPLSSARWFPRLILAPDKGEIVLVTNDVLNQGRGKILKQRQKAAHFLERKHL